MEFNLAFKRLNKGYSRGEVAPKSQLYAIQNFGM